VTSTHAFSGLTSSQWEWTVGFVTTGGRALSAYPHYCKAVLEEGCLKVVDPGIARQHVFSIGTIVGGAAIPLKFRGGRNLGTVEEWFVSRLKPGSRFVFGGRKLELVRFHQGVATVRPAEGAKTGEVAVWTGSKMPLSTELGRAVAALLSGRREGDDSPEMRAVAPILAIQEAWSQLPREGVLLGEFTRSREGEHVLFYPFAGRLVHEGLGTLLAHRLDCSGVGPVQVSLNDYGFCLTARRGLPFDEGTWRRLFTTEGLLQDISACMNLEELARRQFRGIARVAGLLAADYPGQRRPVRSLQVSATLLHEVFARYDTENLLLEQCRREILEHQMDFLRLRSTLEELAGMEWVLQETERLTPLAFPLWADRLSAHLPAGDAASRLERMLADLEEAAS
jgi:ATP-dependent Lhr-like helicase